MTECHACVMVVSAHIGSRYHGNSSSCPQELHVGYFLFSMTHTQTSSSLQGSSQLVNGIKVLSWEAVE